MQKLAFAACDCEFVNCEFVEPATPACELEFVPEFIVSQAAPAEGVGAWADAEDPTTAKNISPFSLASVTLQSVLGQWAEARVAQDILTRPTACRPRLSS